ncbi:PAS domain-containing protein [Ideonella sp. 4Y11]|uniref:PAS domain-containing protein n=1 Tax=Ideonella aquatica TaxID=2824119 RepID=A0A941BHX3_9BURK|nr:PAS domain-containing methyl-accepting chemotaxis protein [Ideonella aquatica]MBQ0961346.1 PAS domain-containing protein [Ideonella aquatica]
MRLNLPVIPEEYLLPPGASLVSTTDLKGRITYCNAAFIEVSGYTRDELMGQPHNLIRHPDMPAEGFRDLWATIAAGRPWTGVVKNRRKDGRHYWVQANVTPIVEDGQPVGYLSVRGVPTREQVAACEALYATMRAEAQAGRLLHVLKAGRVLRADWRGRLAQALQLGLGQRVSLSVGAIGLAGVLAGTGLARALDGQALAAAVVAVGALATFGGGWWLNRLTTRPMLSLLRTANRMAAGDMTQVLASDRDDLVGQFIRALNQLNVNLRSIVADARAEVDRMRAAAREIAVGNQDLSQRTESQAANLQRTASSMEAITGTVRHNADTARQAAQCAQQANAVTLEGADAVQQVTATMHGIRDSSGRIDEIIGVIEGIAFQTNLLALNAAVEAARAGAQGRGFAVVAGEVRALAQRSSAAAREVKHIIDDSSHRVATGNQLTEAAGGTMGHAMNSVRQVSQLIDEISQGADRQLQDISEVTAAVSSLDEITQKNAALVEQVAAAAMQLESQALAVADAVSVFRLHQGDHHAAPDAVALRQAAKANA